MIDLDAQAKAAAPKGSAVSDAYRRSAKVVAVESRCGAVTVGRTYLFPPLSSGGASLVRPWLRFHTPLIEPDMRISQHPALGQDSRLRPRHVVPKPDQTDEPVVPVEV